MNILFAVDQFSDVKAAARLLNALTFANDSTLYVVHVLDEELLFEAEQQDGKQIERKQRPEVRTRPTIFPAHIPSRAELEAQARSMLNEAVHELRTMLKFPVEPLFRTGVPGAEILQTIEERSIDLVMVGTRKHTLREVFLLGSVSDWILNEAPCPVLVLRSNEQKGPAGGTLEVLIAVDGSSDAWTAVEFLKRLGPPPGSHITILHVVKQHLPDGPLRFSTSEIPRENFANTVEAELGVRGKNAVTLLEKTATSFQGVDGRVDLELAFGHEAEEILKSARTIHPHLIVLGSRGLTGLRRTLLGGVSSRVARHAPCSTLIVR